MANKDKLVTPMQVVERAFDLGIELGNKPATFSDEDGGKELTGLTMAVFKMIVRSFGVGFLCGGGFVTLVLVVVMIFAG